MSSYGNVSAGCDIAVNTDSSRSKTRWKYLDLNNVKLTSASALLRWNRLSIRRLVERCVMSSMLIYATNPKPY